MVAGSRRVPADRRRHAVGARHHAHGQLPRGARRVRARAPAPQAPDLRAQGHGVQAGLRHVRRGVPASSRAEYPDVRVDDVIVDTFAMRLVRDPQSFDVVVTTNMFGDILSDEAAGLVGGLGMAPGLCIGDGDVAMAQATHGSAPDIAGKGIANPYAMIESTRMLLEWLGHDRRRPERCAPRATCRVRRRRRCAGGRERAPGTSRGPEIRRRSPNAIVSRCARSGRPPSPSSGRSSRGLPDVFVVRDDFRRALGSGRRTPEAACGPHSLRRIMRSGDACRAGLLGRPPGVCVAGFVRALASCPRLARGTGLASNGTWLHDIRVFWRWRPAP